MCWLIVTCWQASYIIFHVCSHRYVTNHKSAVHAWRQNMGICGSTVLQILSWDLKCARVLPPWYHIIYLWCNSWQIRRHVILVWNYSVTNGENTLHWITAIEIWARICDLELKRQSFDKCHPQLSWKFKDWQNLTPMKQMIIMAYNAQGVHVCHITPKGAVVDAHHCQSFLH